MASTPTYKVTADYTRATTAVVHSAQFFFEFWPHWVTRADVVDNDVTTKQILLRDNVETEANEETTITFVKPGHFYGQNVSPWLPGGGYWTAKDTDSPYFVRMAFDYAPLPDADSYLASSYVWGLPGFASDSGVYSDAVDAWYNGIGAVSANQAQIGVGSTVYGTITSSTMQTVEYFRNFQFQADGERILGSAYSDVLQGGAGADYFKPGKGNDLIDGGSSQTNGVEDRDVVEFDAQRWQYQLTDTEGVDVVTKVKNINGGGGFGTDELMRIEDVIFKGGYVGKSIQGNTYLEAAYFAQEAYNSARATGDYRGWTALNALDLKLPHIGDGYKLLNGAFVTPGSQPFTEHAVAKAYLANWNGQKTVMIAFRGTDFDESILSSAFLDDARFWRATGDYYALFETFITAVDAFIEEYGVSQVLVTGHSLGGAMVQHYMEQHDGSKYIAATFGSPATLPANENDNRILNFAHQEDIVSHPPAIFSNWSGLDAGARVIIPMNQLNPTNPAAAEFDDGKFNGASINLTEHNMAAYLASVKNLVAIGHDETEFLNSTRHDPDTLIRIAAGDHNSNAFGGDDGFDVGDILLGGGKVDYIRGFEGNDKIYGGVNWDYLYGDEGDDFIVGGDHTDTIYGGQGADILFGSDAYENDFYRDYYVYTAMKDSGLSVGNRDVIYGHFDGPGSDKIDLSRLATGSGRSEFVFIGTDSFAKDRPGEVRVIQDNGGWMVQINTDADRNPEMSIFVVSSVAPGAEDFIL